MKRIAISSCLLGVPCRYDGKSKSVNLECLGPEVDFFPFCPEMAAGLGCPRAPIELVENGNELPRVMGVNDRTDVTGRLREACKRQADSLASQGGADLFLLKARSPSCGKCSPLHALDGTIVGTAPGEWARQVKTRFPNTPIWTEEDILARCPSR